MKRAAAALAAAVLASGVGTGTALGAVSKAKPWQSVAGVFKTKAAASKEVKALSGKGFSGFSVEVEKRGQAMRGKKFEVEKGFATQKQARAQVAKLRMAGFKKASVENEKSEKRAR